MFLPAIAGTASTRRGDVIVVGAVEVVYSSAADPFCRSAKTLLSGFTRATTTTMTRGCAPVSVSNNFYPAATTTRSASLSILMLWPRRRILSQGVWIIIELREFLCPRVVSHIVLPEHETAPAVTSPTAGTNTIYIRWYP